MAEIKGADLLAKSLKEQGVEYMFGVVGSRSGRSPKRRRRSACPISACATSRPRPMRRRRRFLTDGPARASS